VRPLPNPCVPILLSLLLSLTLSACGQTGHGSQVRLPLLNGFSTDPARASGAQLWAESLVYRGLFQFDGSLNVVPDIAVAMPTISLDGRTYTFGITPGEKFADGRAVTASDVAFSLTRALSRAVRSRSAIFALQDIVGAARLASGHTSTLAGVRVLSPQTLQISLYRPDPTFLTDLALPPASILDRAVVTHHRNWAFLGAAAGPFRLSALAKTILLKPNPHYLAGPLNVSGLQLYPVSSAAAALRLFRQRIVDAAPVPSDQFGTTSSDSGFVWSDVPSAFYLALPSSIPLRIREGISESLDTSTLNSQRSDIDPLTSIVPTSVVPGYAAIPNPFIYAADAGARASSGRVPVISVPASLVGSSIISWLKQAISPLHTQLEFEAGVRDLNQPRVVRIRAPLPVTGSWLRAVGDAEWGSISGAFKDNIVAGNEANIMNGLGPQITDYEAAETMLLQSSLVIPLGVQKQGYLVSGRLQGLAPTPIGLEPNSETWSSVSLG
jgi:hypothetical protein